ncbi:peptidyl-prolyl cis-trans isomerase cyp21-4 [Phtheirospermum japonicum]|uniref:Peptidyl-prolyl cis-trans isomerase cyp21-4 n=1 Tax=Phtheirospermum japonicum TaxID=374723 RepID=A0A830D580_9LAMI|nr:peptidyl-prolyl cis-trans isomerase cyp21-4 [Phtheirospermum japonicum]
MAKIKPQALLQQSKKKKGPSRISAVTIAIYGLIVVVMAFFLFASYRHWNRRSKFQTEDMLSGVEHDSSHVGLKKVVPKYAVINTSKGSITVELYKEGSPEVVNEFVESCQKGRFKGMHFNRVIKNFVIQGGSDINGHESTEDWTIRGKHYNQLDTSLKHEAFMLGTSKTKNDGGGFDLFITTAPIPDLNEKINEIEEADTDEHYRPKAHIGITEVTLKQKL